VLDASRVEVGLTPEATSYRGARPRPSDPLSFVSGFDVGPTGELLNPDDSVPTTWALGDGATALLNLSDGDVRVAGPGGIELFSGVDIPAGDTVELSPGEGQIWR